MGILRQEKSDKHLKLEQFQEDNPNTAPSQDGVSLSYETTQDLAWLDAGQNEATPHANGNGNGKQPNLEHHRSENGATDRLPHQKNGKQLDTSDRLPSGWKIARLGDFLTLQRGKDLPQSQRSQGIYPVIGSNGFVSHHSEFTDIAPGVLVGRSGSAGKVTFVETEYWALNTTLFVKNFYGNDPLFAYYLLSYLNLGRYAEGVSVPTLNRNVVHLLEVAVPEVAQQKAIAHTLRTLQTAKQTRQQELQLEQERKATLMQHLFTHGTRNEPLKQTDLGTIPASWALLKVGEILTLQRGFDLPTSQRKKGNVPVVSSSGITGTHSEAKVTSPGVIIGRYGTLGEPYYLQENFFPLNTTLFVKDFKGNVPKFIYYFLKTIDMLVFSDKTSVPGVNRNHVHNLLTSLPPIEEQQEIVEVLSGCDAKIGALQREIALLEELFRALLEDLMTGRVSALPVAS